MPKSQNGWPVVSENRIVDKRVLGVEFPNGWLIGDVDVIFTDLVIRLNDIERIDDGGCWGYFIKEIEDSDTISNHSSGTAFDYNAPGHPMGKRNTYSESERDQIHDLLERYDGVIRWGGDYSGRPDDMHFEIDDDAAAVKRVADKIRNENEETAVMELAAYIASVARAIDPKVDDQPGDVANRKNLDKVCVYMARAIRNAFKADAEAQ
jgi:hypothetical protein